MGEEGEWCAERDCGIARLDQSGSIPRTRRRAGRESGRGARTLRPLRCTTTTSFPSARFPRSCASATSTNFLSSSTSSFADCAPATQMNQLVRLSKGKRGEAGAGERTGSVERKSREVRRLLLGEEGSTGRVMGRCVRRSGARKCQFRRLFSGCRADPAAPWQPSRPCGRASRDGPWASPSRSTRPTPPRPTPATP